MAKRLLAILEAQDRASPVFARATRGLQILGAAAAAVGAGALGRQLVRGIVDAARAAGEQELAEIKLAQAIRLRGQSVERYLPLLQQQASAFQDLTGFSDELILSQQSLLVSLGATEENIGKLTQAALDLAAGTGKDLDFAFRNLGRTLGGLTGELGEVIPELRDLTREQLQAGEAADVILRLFGGQAEAQINTYSRRIDELAGRYGDLQEAVGAPFRDAFKVVLGEIVSPLIKDTTTLVNETDEYRDSMIRLARASLVATEAIAPFAEILARIVLLKAKRELEQAARAMELFGAVAQAEALKSAKAIELLNAVLTGLGAPVIDLTSKITAARKALDALGGSAARAVTEAAATIEATVSTAVEGTGGYVETIRATTGEVLTLQDAIYQLGQVGAQAFEYQLDQAGDSVETFGNAMRRTLRVEGIGAALAFGDALSDAATGADVSWDEFFESLLRNIAKATLELAAMNAIARAFGLAFGPRPAATGAAGGVPAGYTPPDTFSGYSSLSNPVPVAGAAFGGASLAAGGRTVPVAGPTVNVYQTLNAPNATPEVIPVIRQMMAQARDEAVALVQARVSRGGSYAAAFRGR